MSFASFYVNCLEEQAALLKTQIQKAKLFEKESVKAEKVIAKAAANQAVSAAKLAAQAVKKSKKRSKKVKDPNAPKKPMSAYQMFYMERYAPYKASNPDKAPRDIMGDVGKLWSALPLDQKEKYSSMHEKKMEVYLQQLAEYNATHGALEADAATGSNPVTSVADSDSNSSSGDSDSSSDSDSDSDDSEQESASAPAVIQQVSQPKVKAVPVSVPVTEKPPKKAKKTVNDTPGSSAVIPSIPAVVPLVSTPTAMAAVEVEDMPTHEKKKKKDKKHHKDKA